MSTHFTTSSIGLPVGPRWGPTAGRLASVALLALGVGLVANTSSSTPAPRAARTTWAFLPSWDQAALISFRLHSSELQTVLPTGLTLGADGTVTGSPPVELPVVAHVRGVQVQPVLSNYDGGWQGARADRLLTQPTQNATTIRQLAEMARVKGWDGVNVDFEGLPARDRTPLVAFVTNLRAALGPTRSVSVDVPATPSPTYDLHRLSNAGANVVLMAYDQHTSPGAPGPIASPAWFRHVTSGAARLVPRGHLIVGIPTYGYDWTGSRPPVAVSNSTALTLAAQARTLPTWSASGGEARITYRRNGRRHVIWLADALAVSKDLAALPTTTPVALWRLGAEDAGTWPVLTSAAGRVDASQLSAVAPALQVDVRGHGDVVRAVRGRDGTRRVAPDHSSEQYLTLPRPWRMDRATGGGKRVAITFDDGPSPTWTPPILAELQRLHVPATFFVIGQNAASHPDLIRQEIAAGFTIGNHTFSHYYPKSPKRRID